MTYNNSDNTFLTLWEAKKSTSVWKNLNITR